MNVVANQQGAHGGLRELALFAGAGGGILGGHLLGWCTVCAVENDPYAASVLCCRQNDGVLPPFPIWDDVRSFRGHEWRGRVDVISGGFPCTDISSAGKGAGIDGEASGLWREMARIVGEVRPRYVFVENSPLLVSRGLAVVLGDLASLGYDARWCVLGADDAGAPHRRKRIWIVADATGTRCGEGEPGAGGEIRNEAWRKEPERRSCNVADSESISSRPGLREDGPQRDGDQFADGGADVPDADRERQQEQRSAVADGTQYAEPERCNRWFTEPSVRRMADGLASELDQHGAAAAGYLGRVATGVPARVDQLKCLGNGQVPLCAAMAWRILTEEMEDR